MTKLLFVCAVLLAVGTLQSAVAAPSFDSPDAGSSLGLLGLALASVAAFARKAKG